MTDILGGSNNGHAGAVWKAKWADPEYGQIIASCGYDKQFIIWEETENKDNNSKKQWSKRYLNLCRDNVKDIKFAPRHLGLQLAVALENGNVIIYEAKDLNNLTSWTEIFDIKTNSTGCNCLSWNPAFDELPMIVVGCNDYQT
jgi:WD40 repeat protein